jgi:hypothetical protein
MRVQKMAQNTQTSPLSKRNASIANLRSSNCLYFPALALNDYRYDRASTATQKTLSL